MTVLERGGVRDVLVYMDVRGTEVKFGFVTFFKAFPINISLIQVIL